MNTSPQARARTSRRVKPTRQLFLTFIGVIVAGTALLMLPMSRSA